MNSFLSKSSNLTTDKLYEQKYLKYKSKYLKYIEDNNKIQKGGARYRVLVKKQNEELYEIFLWDSYALPVLKKTKALHNEEGYICSARYTGNDETTFILIQNDYPAIGTIMSNNPTDEIKQIIATYFAENNKANETAIRNAFSQVKEYFTKNTNWLSIELFP